MWKFSHSETIKIPERFFDREEGSIMLGFVEYSVDSQTYGSVKSINVNFRVAGDSWCLRLTEAGQQFYDDFESITRQIEDLIHRGMDPQETETPRRLLLRAADNLTSEEDNA